MSQLFELDFSSDALPIDDLAHSLHDVIDSGGLLGLGNNLANAKAGRYRLASTLDVVIVEPDDHPWGPDEVEATFGMVTAISVWMSAGGGDGGLDQYCDVVKTTIGLLKRVAGDAVLHYEGYAIWLARINGRLTLSDNDERWTPELLALVDIPYERAPLAFVE